MNNIWDHLPHPFIILAPMEGVTDAIFRQVIARAGRPDLFFTEFTNVSSFASSKGRENALERLQVAPTDPPIIAQVWGKHPDHFAALAGALVELGFSGLDINMGCPDRHVNATGGGAAMIRTPDLALECIREARAATPLPLSIKTRLGYTSVDEYRTWIPTLLKTTPAALTIHLRTRKEMSKVPAHYELIDSLVALRDQFSPTTKLIINGDIKDLTAVQALSAKHPKVDGFMIGRGVFENPFCFTDRTPTTSELLDLFRFHLNLFDAADAKLKIKRSRLLGEGIDAPARGLPFDPLKHFFKIYIHTFPGASDLRARLMECKSTTAVREILDQIALP